jgi:hypothetical protein
MYPPVATNDPRAVQGEIRRVYSQLYPDGDPKFVDHAFDSTIAAFIGKHSGYRPIDARYHDLEHTMQGTLCMTRLLHGRARAGAEPRLTEREFRLGLLAILLHDTGYLKRVEDASGTGAKYTVTHVSRSAEFAGALLGQQGYPLTDIQTVQNMIRCTGLNAKLSALAFASAGERITGYALATADLLGQMAAEDYVDKLPILFTEFAEAASFSGDRSHFVSIFANAEDLIGKTPGFWHSSIRPKLDTELLGLWMFLNDPYPDGPNEYMDRIEANLDRIRSRAVTPRDAGLAAPE